jgi:hypothetical protein
MGHIRAIPGDLVGKYPHCPPGPLCFGKLEHPAHRTGSHGLQVDDLGHITMVPLGGFVVAAGITIKRQRIANGELR